MLKVCKKLFFLFVISVGVLHADDSYENKKIADNKLSIQNSTKATQEDTKAYLNKLSSQIGLLFTQEVFDNDLKSLSKDFDRIDPDVVIKDNKIYITIKLWQRQVIAIIDWKGNEKIKTKKLQKELGVKTQSIYNKNEFNTALNKVKEYYIKKGFFESSVTYNIIPMPNNEIKIQINIKEGKSGRIEKIVYKGFTSKEKNEISSFIFTKKYNLILSLFTDRGTYKEEAIENDKMVIINYLQNKGYADAKVDINIQENPISKKMIVEIVAHRGTLYRFGKVTYDGNCLFTDEEILKYFLIYPNDPYSPEKIRETIQAIKDAYGAKGYAEAQISYDTKLLENEPIYNINFYIEEGDLYKIGLIKIFGNKSTQTSVILRQSLL